MHTDDSHLVPDFVAADEQTQQDEAGRAGTRAGHLTADLLLGAATFKPFISGLAVHLVEVMCLAAPYILSCSLHQEHASCVKCLASGCSL